MAVEKPNVEEIDEMAEAEALLKALEDAEKAVDRAYSTGKADRAKITQSAQLDAAEAVAMAGLAMEADEEADEAMRLSVIAERSGDREQAKIARQKERAARKKANVDHKAATRSAKQAYDAIKFSAPNKMGFMRAVQVLFAVHIAVVLVFLMLTSRDAVQYNVTTVMDWVMIVLEGVAFWMFINRYKIARPFVIAMAAFGLVVPAVVGLALGRFAPFELISNGAFYIFLIFYFALSRRVKATLVNDFSQHKGDFEKEDFRIERRGWPFVRNLIMYFIIFSILGHWMEMGMCQFIIMGLVEGEYDPSNTMLWRDWLYPFPMEGAAVVIIALVLYPLYIWMKKKFKPVAIAYVVSFLANALVCSIIEFSMGLIVNADLQLWDYSEQFGNIMGQVCLQNTMAFGVAASLIAWFVYPLLERQIARVPRDVMNIVFVVVAVFGAIVWSLYLINPPGVDEYNANPDVPREVLLKESEVNAAASRLAQVENSVDRMIDGLNQTTQLENKDIMVAELESIRAELRTILKDDLGLEEYPGVYEQFIAEVQTPNDEGDQAQE